MKVAFYLKRPDSKTETAIFARISYNGVQLKYYLPENIAPKFWNKDTHRAKVTQKFKEYPEFNARLDYFVATIKTVYRKYQNDNANAIPNPETLKELLDREIKQTAIKTQTHTFLSFFEEFINQTKTGVRIQPKSGKPYSKNTIKVYVTAYKHVLNYQNHSKKKVDFDSIDVGFYLDFTDYLTKVVKLSTNAIGKNVSNIKLVMSEAYERNLHKSTAFKSKRFIVVREKSDSIYLTEAEISEMENLDLSGNSKLDRVRDLFLIGCHTGLRYSDYSTLEPKHIKDGLIEIIQTKTGEPVVIPLHTTVERIMAKYSGSLPRSISNQKTNEYLKELGQMLPSLEAIISKSITKGGQKITMTHKKWELLTTHTARRSFATNMYLMDIPAYTIMAITGHRTEQSFKKYIKLSSSEHAKVMKMHWDKASELRAVK